MEPTRAALVGLFNDLITAAIRAKPKPGDGAERYLYGKMAGYLAAAELLAEEFDLDLNPYQAIWKGAK